MHRPTVIVLLAILVPACSLMPAKSEHVRARQMEDAVLPMAATALETGQVETARRLYRRLLDIDPESMPARMGLGDVALQERDTAAAARWYLSALTRAGEPEDRRAALLAHGRAALAAGQLEAARESFTRLTEPGENAPRASVAWGHNGIGLTLLLEGDLHGAVAALERAVLRAPEEERFRANLDRALAMLSEFPAPEVSSSDRQDVDVPSVRQRDDNRPERSLTKPPEPAVDEPVSPIVTAVETQDREQRAPPKPHRSAVTSPDETKVPSSESVAEVGRVEGAGAGTNEHPPAEEAGLSTQPAMGKIEDGGPTVREVDESEEAGLSTQPAMGKIEDRGPTVREVDESEEAGLSTQPAMGKIEDGGPTVREVDESPATEPPSPRVPVLVVTENNLPFLQFGAYAKPANAESVAARLRDLTGQTVTISDIGDRADVSLHRVRMGPIPSGDTLLELIAALEAEGYRIANAPRSSADDGIRNGQAHRPIKTVLVHAAGEQFLQAGAYNERSTAETLARQLQGLTDRPVRVSEVARPDGPPLHRVRIGPIEPDDPLIELIGPAD